MFSPGKKRGIAYTKIAQMLFIIIAWNVIPLTKASNFVPIVALCRRWRYGLHH